MKISITLLALFLTTYAHAGEETIAIRFRAFGGEKRCKYIKSTAALFVDRWIFQGKRQINDTAWRKLDEGELRHDSAITIPLKEVPADPKKMKMYLRMYVVHDIHHADHYIAEQLFTQDFVKSLPANEPVIRETELKPDFDSAHEHRKCKLKYEITRHVPSPQAPANDPDGEGIRDMGEEDQPGESRPAM